MVLSEKIIEKTIQKNQRYLDALEAADKQGTKPALRKVRKNFTIDEITFQEFQQKCEQQKRTMSNVVEELMKNF